MDGRQVSAHAPRTALHGLRPVHLLLFLPWLVLLGWMADVAWFLTDDAFISFRYARNLLEGHGLVFNPGERVKGYSSAPARNRLTDRSAPRSAGEAVLGRVYTNVAHRR